MCSQPSRNLFKLVRSFFPMEMKIYTLNIKKTGGWHHGVYECQGYKKKKKKTKRKN